MQTTTLDVSEAQIRFGEVLALVVAGTEVVLTDGNRPLARLVPIAPPPPERVEGLHLGAIWMSPDFDEPLSDDFWLGPG